MGTLAQVAPWYQLSVVELWQRAGYLRSAGMDTFIGLLTQAGPLAFVEYGLSQLPLPEPVRAVIGQLIQNALAPTAASQEASCRVQLVCLCCGSVRGGAR
jgi:hypothetical protein